ncbi:hypothetical protein CFC21_106689 [Triticum aestivum]|uniref:NAC domain-containing protein n=2 Tax=Triticum aestivum TaxID=4565 RepID=A0A3B6TBT2_WHEAT|nr:hypothetical protein CFC21_106689 [Triticum aestivum]
METGFVFSPADHELTDLYLGGQIAGHPVFSTFIHHADVYSAAPAELVAGREHVRDRDGNEKKKSKLRTIDDDPSKSYWHSESGKKPVEGSAVGGYVQDFVYAIKKDGHVERLGWRMKEYGLSTEHGDGDFLE